jgi:phosphate transport system permease protein
MEELTISDDRPDSVSSLSPKDVREKGELVTGEWPKVKRQRKIMQGILFGLFKFSAAINAVALLIIIYFLVSRGWTAINWTFLTQPPTDSMTKGGILPCIVGTLCLSLGAILVAFPIGVASAIYLHEYARPGRLLRLIRLGINNLAGVPSIVFGLFGLAFFVVWLQFGVSILAGSLTLGAMTLPVIIGASEEALRAVPDTYREASLGLGATKWQTIYRVPSLGFSPEPSWESAGPPGKPHL